MMQQLIHQYPNAEIAFQRFSQLLRQIGYAIINRLPKNIGRHSLIITPNTDFYCLYRDSDVQHGTLEKFNELFQDFVIENPQYRGHAESINKEILDQIISKYDPFGEKRIFLVFIYKDTKKYISNPFLFKKFAEANKLIRTHNAIDIRKTFNGNFKAINETTYHLPLKKPFFINFDKANIQ